MKLAALSVDLDGIGEYRALHGLPERAAAAHAAYDVALGRALAFAEDHGLPLTLFAIGRDLSRERSAEALRAAASSGHLVENHSLDHRYDLTALSADDIAAQIDGGAQAILSVVDRRPRGFRAPGYLCNARVFSALDSCGVSWDSSAFPAPAYAAAKLATITWIKLRQRRSRAMDEAPALAVSADPHRPAGHGFVELPIAVTRRLRLPVIGTVMSLLGPRGAGWLMRGCLGRPLVNVELHAIDFLDAKDGLDDLAPHQADVRVPLAHKLAAFTAAVDVLRRADHRFVTLDEASGHFA